MTTLDPVTTHSATQRRLRILLVGKAAPDRGGIPTFLEKPLAGDLAGVDRLLDLSRRRDVPLMCGFVERFNAALCTAISNQRMSCTSLKATPSRSPTSVLRGSPTLPGPRQEWC